VTANGSRYRVLKWVTCPVCGGLPDGCRNCDGYGQMQVEADLLEALRDLGVMGDIEELQAKVSVVRLLVAYA
jgi:hypothetical protein